MELHQLEYFVAVVETGSFTNAAEQCGISQPSLSQQIIKLEKELGQILFDRLGRKIVITETGEKLYPRALSILSDLQQIKHTLTTTYLEEATSVSIGIIPTLTPNLLYETIQRFKDEYPAATLSITENTTESLIAQLMNGELDTALVSLPIQNRNIVTEELFTEPLLIAIPAGYPVAKEKEPVIDTETLETLPFIRLSDQNCLADQVDSFCYTQQINPEIIFHTSHITTTLEIIRAGMGVSLVPACVVSTAGDGIIFKRFKHHTVERVIVAAHHRRRQQTILSKAFGHLLQQTWHDITQDIINN